MFSIDSLLKVFFDCYFIYIFIMCIDLTVICLNKVYYVYTTKWRRVDHYDVHCAISIIIASYKLLFGKCNHLLFFLEVRLFHVGPCYQNMLTIQLNTYTLYFFGNSPHSVYHIQMWKYNYSYTWESYDIHVIMDITNKTTCIIKISYAREGIFNWWSCT